MNTYTDTIAAISTPRGTGAIAIVRINGNHSIDLVEKIFVSKNNNKLSHAKATFGSIIQDNNSILDQVVVTLFKGPNSFTGEDLVEISCHGGPLVVQSLLQKILDLGARLAEPGEFSTRAFLNGKIDLVQAESIIDVIHAQTQSALQSSMVELTGQLSQKFNYIADTLKENTALLELELDFSDEDIEFAKRDELLKKLKNISTTINNFISTFNYGRIIRDGAHIVITGKPNVGKSSLLNKLLDQDRALVSDIPGTTRDSIEESLNIQGYLFKITDTAGLRQSIDIVEQEGVKRTHKIIEQADILLHLIDINEELEISQEVNIDNNKYHIIIINKIDTVQEYNKKSIIDKFNSFPTIFTSVKQGIGIAEIEQQLLSFISKNEIPETHNIITKVRHRDALVKAVSFLDHAIQSLEKNLSPEFIALDLRAALDQIGEITGTVTTDDILNDIFGKFCIGK